MSNKPENPHARPFTVEGSDGSVITHFGMSLLDHFAGQAMQGMLANPNNKLTEDRAAQWAYVVADAMLRERERRLK